MSIAVTLYMLLSCITAMVVPWLGVVFYYLNAIGQPEDMWPEHFGDSSLSLYISLSIIVGLGLATATTQIDWRRLFSLPNLALMLVVVLFNLSIAASPFAAFEDVKISVLSSAEHLDILNKIMLIYFCSVLLIDTRFKLICLLTAVGGVLLYYSLWANKIYFTNEFWRFGDNGRLNGPFGIYHDENYLAMLYVLATPIFYYLSVGTNIRIIRYGLWLCIPLSWHALFLTGSRGALLSLVVVSLYILVRSYSKRASVVMLVAFVLAVATQSGNMINRITDTVSTEELERERAFIENDEDSPEINGKPVDPRLISWEVGLQIMRDYPLAGVGAGNFMRAWPEYSDTDPHVAHNTFVQFGAASGVGAALVYLYLFFLRLKNAWKQPNPERKNAHGYKRDYLDDLLNSTFIAFYTVALFLDLMIIELTYFVFLVGTCKYILDRPKQRTVRSMIDSIYRWKQGAKEVDPATAPAAVPLYGAIANESNTVAHAPTVYAVRDEVPEQFGGVSEVPEEAPRNQYADSLYAR